MKPTLNIVGCGRLGRTLGRLWHINDTFVLQDVVNRSQASASEATQFIGAGRPLDSCADLRPAQITMIATPDGEIDAAGRALVRSGTLAPGHIVFHCSGALPAGILAEVAALGVATASLHPIRSFADPHHATAHFGGTWCGLEGDERATPVLAVACDAIGAHPVAIDPHHKSIYHAAAVFASNYLVTVLDVSLQAYEKAGVPRDTALKLIEPLVRGTVDNAFSIGTTKALSGPIARGDTATAVRQYRALSAWDRRIGRLYKALAKPTLQIARRRKEGSK